MGNLLLLFVIALTVGAVVFGVMTLVTGSDPGLQPAEPDERATPLPGDRPLVELDVTRATFDITWRGYRMAQVDQTLRRLAYDTGYKNELIQVLEAEVVALREGRLEDADTLAGTRAAALSHAAQPASADASATGDAAGAEGETGTAAAISAEQSIAVEAVAGESADGRPAAGEEPAPQPDTVVAETAVEDQVAADPVIAAEATAETGPDLDTDQPDAAVKAPASGRR